MALERAGNSGDVALTIAEDDGVLHLLGRADLVAQGGALFRRSLADLEQLLIDGLGGRILPSNLDLYGIAQKPLGQFLDFGRHGC